MTESTDELYAPTRLSLWTMPRDYFGAEWPDYYESGMGQTRDSDSLTRSNFICALKALGGESETVLVVRETHWAVGWVEHILIHKTDSKALETMDSLAKDLEGYPVVDESHWSEMESEESAAYWARMSVKERLGWIQEARDKYHESISIFAARSDCVPDSMWIEETLRAA